MENQIAEIFSYSESSLALWEAVKEMYRNQNNAAYIFNLANLQQDGKTYVQLLGTLVSGVNLLYIVPTQLMQQNYGNVKRRTRSSSF